ncbi:HIT family protein [Pseudomonas sp. NPDC089752]|uniref:HIT family protein n=1 Tax=Pseudomonas sp. NPDC089752 TaxID=3364472 RepID=UPI003804CD13
MDIPPRFIVHESRHWIVNHRMDSALPGYLMLSAKQKTNTLSALPYEALAELGVLQARIQEIIESQLKPRRLYISRFGHEAGFSIHFHFIPVYPWVETMFWEDERYRSLQAFGSTESAQPETDGAELTLFVWREFCERPDPPPVHGPSVDKVIAVLCSAFKDSFTREARNAL